MDPTPIRPASPFNLMHTAHLCTPLDSTRYPAVSFCYLKSGFNPIYRSCSASPGLSSVESEEDSRRELFQSSSNTNGHFRFLICLHLHLGLEESILQQSEPTMSTFTRVLFEEKYPFQTHISTSRIMIHQKQNNSRLHKLNLLVNT